MRTEPELLIPFDRIENFAHAKAIASEAIGDELLATVRELDERNEIEPFIRSILCDTQETPHGPVEIADIFTHRVIVSGAGVMAAFILKGKSFGTVRPRDVSHQIYRLEKITGLQLMILAASGTVLDEAKEQFCSTAVRLGSRFSLLDANDLARLFVAYGFLCPRDGSRIRGGQCRCGYRPIYKVPNLLQESALTELRLSRELGRKAGLVVLPPASGKTTVAALDAQRVGAHRLLYVAHTHEILESAAGELESVFGREAVHHHRKPASLRQTRQVNLATIQLLDKHADLVRAADYDFVVVDEFHHAAAPSYRRLLASTDPVFVLGLTATPFRGDRQDIRELCENNVVVEYDLRAGIDHGILCPYHYYGCFDDIDYSRLQFKGRRYSIRDLERALILPERDSAIARKWRERAEGVPTLAFCCSHRHAVRVAASFREEGIPAEVYLSSTPWRARREIAERFRKGDIKVLCTVDVMNEGVNLPFVECLLFLRPTETRRIFYQQLGRGLRRFVGKPHCVVIDFIGNFKNAFKIVEYHGLESEEGLELGGFVRSPKELLSLPLGCKVHFDERVIDVFAQQSLDPRCATRHTIGRILLWQLLKLRRQLGRDPQSADVNRNCILDMRLYRLVFNGLPDLSEYTRVEVG